MFKIKKLHKSLAELFICERHYSDVMPRHTKHFLGFYQGDKLIGVLTLGWGTNPKGTIQKLFPTLSHDDYFEIGKFCVDDDMSRNTESKIISQAITWIKLNEPQIKYLYTWADGIVGKVGYVYQASNFLYGGFIWSEIYLSKEGEKIHFRTLQRELRNQDGRSDLIYGPRPDREELKKRQLKHIWGKQFRYIYPINKSDRRQLKSSTINWNINYPKHKDLEWRERQLSD